MQHGPPLTANDFVMLSDILEAGSLAEAARRMNLSRASLSLRVKQLEQRIGLQVFRRNTHHLLPTEAGIRLCEQGSAIKGVMQTAAAVLYQSADVLSGSLHVCMPTGFGTRIMKHWIFEFSRLHPRVKIRVTQENGVDDLVGRNIDVSVRIANKPPEGVVARRIRTVRYGLYAAPELVRHAGEPVTPADVSLLPMLVSDFVGRRGQVVARRGTEKQIIQVLPRLVTANFLLIRDAIADGLGWGFLPDYLADDTLPGMSLVRVLNDWSFDAYGSHLYVMRLPERHQSPLAKAFADFICGKARQADPAVATTPLP